MHLWKESPLLMDTRFKLRIKCKPQPQINVKLPSKAILAIAIKFFVLFTLLRPGKMIASVDFGDYYFCGYFMSGLSCLPMQNNILIVFTAEAASKLGSCSDP